MGTIWGHIGDVMGCIGDIHMGKGVGNGLKRDVWVTF